MARLWFNVGMHTLTCVYWQLDVNYMQYYPLVIGMLTAHNANQLPNVCFAIFNNFPQHWFRATLALAFRSGRIDSVNSGAYGSAVWYD